MNSSLSLSSTLSFADSGSKCQSDELSGTYIDPGCWPLAEASFPQAKRELPVSFRYPQRIEDVVEMEVPARMKMESVPEAAKLELAGVGTYALSVTASGAKFVTKRSSDSMAIMIPVADFEKLRGFTTRYEEKDHESVVLKTGS